MSYPVVVRTPGREYINISQPKSILRSPPRYPRKCRVPATPLVREEKKKLINQSLLRFIIVKRAYNRLYKTWKKKKHNAT